MPDPISGAPEDPREDSLKIDGVVYRMYIGSVALYELSLMGIDLMDVFTISDKERRVTSYSFVLRLFRALTANHFVAKNEPVPSSEQWALRLEGADKNLIEEISRKTLTLIYPKVMARATKMELKEPAPMSEPVN